MLRQAIEKLQQVSYKLEHLSYQLFGLVWFGLYFGISTSTTITYPKYPGSMTLLEAVTKDPGYAYIDLWM
jgi:tryptophan-rich sensory protein